MHKTEAANWQPFLYTFGSVKLEYTCPSCNTRNKVSASFVSNRLDLAKKLGEEFEQRCTHCGANNLVHVDDVRAEKDWFFGVVLFLPVLAVILELLLIFVIPGKVKPLHFMNAALVAGPIFSTKYQHTKIHQFNLLYYNSSRFRK